jgi:sugar/nucleoside kinase (ribokinase family)
MQRKINIVAVGDLTADLVMPSRLPVTPGDSREVPFHTVEPGGAFNFLIAGQRMCSDHAQMHAVGPIGDDLYGREIARIMADEQVNTASMIAMPGAVTTVVLVLMEPGTGKFAYVWRGGNGHPLPMTAQVKATIDQADALFLQGYTLCEPQMPPILAQVFESRRPIWFDVGPASTSAPEALREDIRRHAHAILSTEQELPLIAGGRSGQDAFRYLLDYGLRMLIVKRGRDGCRIVTREYGDIAEFDTPAFPVQVADVVGAGDCFNAMFIAAACRGIPLYECALLANAAGAAKVQKLGTGRSMPTRAEVQAVLTSFQVNVAL